MNLNFETQQIIKKYNLKPHPEGGYAQLLYEDTHKIQEHALPLGFNGSRSICNAIYYLLTEADKSILHRLTMNELWNFYFGCPLELYDISENGNMQKIILGQNISHGEHVAYVFQKGHWIGAKPLQNQKLNFSFVSCVTSPGFTFLDWEKGDRQKLIKNFPHLKEIILELTN